MVLLLLSNELQKDQNYYEEEQELVKVARLRFSPVTCLSCEYRDKSSESLSGTNVYFYFRQFQIPNTFTQMIITQYQNTIQNTDYTFSNTKYTIQFIKYTLPTSILCIWNSPSKIQNTVYRTVTELKLKCVKVYENFYQKKYSMCRCFHDTRMLHDLNNEKEKIMNPNLIFKNLWPNFKKGPGWGWIGQD